MVIKEPFKSPQFANLKLDDVVLDNFEDADKLKKYKNIYWHEIGHLIGKFICKDLGLDFGVTKLINFSISKPKIENVFNSDVLKIRSHETNKECRERDYYRELNGRILDVNDINTKKIINKEFDTNILCPYLVYIIMGGLFNLYIFYRNRKNKISKNSFKRIFKNISTEKVNQNYIYGCAGADWVTFKLFCSAFKIPIISIREYIENIYAVLEKNNFFEHFNNQIQEVISNEIQQFEGEDLKNFEENFKTRYNTFPQRQFLLNELAQINEVITSNFISL